MCITNLNNIKGSLKKEVKEIDLARQIKLIRELGEPASNFRIIDSQPMTPELIDEFELEIKTGVPGRPPKGRAYTNRPTLGDKYEIRWRYDLRDGVDGPKKLPDGRTRVFCVELLDADRNYSESDINTMSNGMGWNSSVFRYAGGYWTQPDGSVSPQCRHQWNRVFVERK